MSGERERQEKRLREYVAQHDKGKVPFVGLWATGSLSVRPGTVTWNEETGFVKTGMADEHVPFEEIRLPAPFDKGVDFACVTKEDVRFCVNYVELTFPWFRGSFRVDHAREQALKNPGVSFKYDVTNGFWRSSVYKYLKNFWTWYVTGVDGLAFEKALKDKKKEARYLKKKQATSGSATAACQPQNSPPECKAKKQKVFDAPSPCASVAKDVVRGVPVGVPVDEERPQTGKWVPEIEDSYIRDARMVTSCESLMKYLRNHENGDYVKNPYRKLAGAHAMPKTKQTAKDNIKKVITQWALTTASGQKWLRSCNLASGEFTVDRVVSRNGKSKGTNCVWNLVLMPSRVNSYFSTNDDKKREYVGEKAWHVAVMANEVFHEQAEVDFDFEAACAKRAAAIVTSVNL